MLSFRCLVWSCLFFTFFFFKPGKELQWVRIQKINCPVSRAKDILPSSSLSLPLSPSLSSSWYVDTAWPCLYGSHGRPSHAVLNMWSRWIRQSTILSDSSQGLPQPRMIHNTVHGAVCVQACVRRCLCVSAVVDKHFQLGYKSLFQQDL